MLDEDPNSQNSNPCLHLLLLPTYPNYTHLAHLNPSSNALSKASDKEPLLVSWKWHYRSERTGVIGVLKMKRLYIVKEGGEGPRLSQKWILVRLVVCGMVRWRGRDDGVSLYVRGRLVQGDTSHVVIIIVNSRVVEEGTCAWADRHLPLVVSGGKEERDSYAWELGATDSEANDGSWQVK